MSSEDLKTGQVKTAGFAQHDWFVLQLCSLPLSPLSVFQFWFLANPQGTGDAFLIVKATHKGFRAGTERSGTNVKDRKVSYNDINVREVKTLCVSLCACELHVI